MADAMAYSPARPDPVSVAAYIVQYYRIEAGVKGEALREIYREASEVGKRVLDGQKDLPIQDAIDLVETARVKKAVARYIPRNISNSIVARDFEGLLASSYKVGDWAVFYKRLPQEGIDIVDVGKVVYDRDHRCDSRTVAYRPEEYLDLYPGEFVYGCYSPWHLILIERSQQSRTF